MMSASQSHRFIPELRKCKRTLAFSVFHSKVPVIILSILFLISPLLLWIAVSLSFPNVTYIASDAVSSLFHAKDLPVAVSESGLEFNTYSLAQLAEDPRVTLNRSMMLINTDYKLSDDFQAELTCYGDTDLQMNPLLTDGYKALADAVREQYSTSLFIRSAYRTHEEQVQEYANNDAATLPGASEHEAGLALDVYVPYHAGSSFIKSTAGQWVDSNCSDYGFIIRYPYYGEKSTSIAYEPWHLRYVGTPHAQIISENRLTLEEYYELFDLGTIYSCKGYYISLQTADEIRLTADYSQVTISEDNRGYYLVTWQ